MATRDSETPDPILEQHFRYSGPRPRTKETAILMLADRVEAATRTLPRQTPGRLRSFIWEIVQDVRDDGQLDDSELNFRDLQTIVRSFVNTIGALNHERVEYPGANLDALDEEASDFSDQSNRAADENELSTEGAGNDAGF
jgi:cyclic-di-AMP phosphodiesterase PgpH